MTRKLAAAFVAVFMCAGMIGIAPSADAHPDDNGSGYVPDGDSLRVARPTINNESIYVRTSGTWVINGPKTQCVLSGGPGARCKANAPGDYTITHMVTGSKWTIYVWVASPGTDSGPSGKPADPHPEPWQEIPSKPLQDGIWV